MRQRTAILLFASALIVAANCRVSFAAHPIVPTFERLFAEADGGSTAGGWLLAGELGCAACHQADGLTEITPKQAPILDGVAERIRPDHLLKYIADPQAARPGSSMPNVLAGLSAKEREASVLAIVHYLQSLGSNPPLQEYASTSGRARGDSLYHRVGCVACHGARHEGAKQLPTSKHLGNLEQKYTLPSLVAFLRDPHKTRPSGRMPSLNLSLREATDLASYLLPNLPARSGITWEMYKGRFERMPDFSKLTPEANGDTEVIGVGVTDQKDQFALRFEGVLPIAEKGEYTFYTNSDDGSKLLVNDQLVVDNDGVHGGVLKSGKIQLEPGRYSVTIEFFERDGGEHIHAEFEGPGIKRQLLAPFLMAGTPEEPLDDLAFPVDEKLAEKGRTLFASVGCSSCHQLKDPQRRDQDLSRAKPFAELTDGGCLNDDARSGVPHYCLSDAQRQSLKSVLGLAAERRTPPTAKQKVAHSLATFNCYACHARDELGGVEQERLEYFQTTQPEMGIEGSVPPHLNGIGAKLTRLWFENILAEGAKDRPYMHTRMPKFGTPNVGHLAAAMERLDAVDPPSDPDLPVSREVKKLGWEMVGEKGFSCIKCHTFGRYRATGVQSIDMTTMHKRLRKDWFRTYVRNPLAYRRDTRMPSSWPLELEESFFPEILDGDCDQQIQAVWHYLSDGTRARVPAGLVTNSLELIPASDAIIYRNFLEGAGPRAIGVGYPEALNLAFDANDLRLALIWKGAFIDAQRHWTGRGQGFQGPAGDSVVKLPQGVSFAILESPDATWPKQSARLGNYRFRGYSLTDDQRPTFKYSVGDFQVEDFPNVVEQGVQAFLVRKIRVTGGKSGERLFYRAAVGDIKDLGDGEFGVGDLKVKFAGDCQPTLVGNQLMVELKAGSEITQVYDW